MFQCTFFFNKSVFNALGISTIIKIALLCTSTILKIYCNASLETEYSWKTNHAAKKWMPCWSLYVTMPGFIAVYRIASKSARHDGCRCCSDFTQHPLRADHAHWDRPIRAILHICECWIFYLSTSSKESTIAWPQITEGHQTPPFFKFPDPDTLGATAAFPMLTQNKWVLRLCLKASTDGEDLMVCGNWFQRAGLKTLNDPSPVRLLLLGMIKRVCPGLHVNVWHCNL